jgi:hypothetical protein
MECFDIVLGDGLPVEGQDDGLVGQEAERMVDGRRPAGIDDGRRLALEEIAEGDHRSYARKLRRRHAHHQLATFGAVAQVNHLDEELTDLTDPYRREASAT